MMLKILLLNGPPGSGKDEVAKTAYEIGYQARHEKFANPLRYAASALLGIDEDDLEATKRRDPRVRQLMIQLSEGIIKPVYGFRHFGMLCANRVIDHHMMGHRKVIISDCGFASEVEAFEEILTERLLGDVELQLWQIHRPGCSYAGDSRCWIELPGRTRKVFNSQNDLDHFKEDVRTGLEGFFGAP